jgi:hypothetical protein
LTETTAVPTEDDDEEEQAYQEIYRKMNLPKTAEQKQEQADYDSGTKKLGEFLLMGYTMLEHSCEGRLPLSRVPSALHGRQARQGLLRPVQQADEAPRQTDQGRLATRAAQTANDNPASPDPPQGTESPPRHRLRTVPPNGRDAEEQGSS